MKIWHLCAEEGCSGTLSLSFTELTKDIPFPVTHYTLSKKELVENEYPVNKPGDFYSATIYMLIFMTICILKKFSLPYLYRFSFYSSCSSGISFLWDVSTWLWDGNTPALECLPLRVRINFLNWWIMCHNLSGDNIQISFNFPMWKVN